MSNNTDSGGRGIYAAAGDALVDVHDWGRLEWMVSGKNGNSEVLTVGKCFIHPGMGNPFHYHPNCDEVLHVVKGRIRKHVGDEHFDMSPGDTISIPTGAMHRAENIGDGECELLICYDNANRQVVGEGLSS